MCIATIETVILTLETLETAKIEFLGVHGRHVLLLVLNLVQALVYTISVSLLVLVFPVAHPPA